ncbi:superoxide dismutase [Oscillatoriales cyanobacterium LEGE 11467]|uniref:Superoxide dismutase n=1 Tax=Zarconia navalis LEGE 11467 TaxID=1828826 RepID=A0A928VX61_9CYAN|nr:superoxide dismutase [Zarconia navalis]MBE9041914.1 superoxide dismutase [Zarconia navalis LEGE 11467]
MSLNRRRFLYTLGIGTLTFGGFSACAFAQPSNSQEDETFALPPLPYDYNALEPYIDAETMRFHHDKHHAGYTRKLNAAVNRYPELKTKSAIELLEQIDGLPTDIQSTVRNNGGGYVNHKMFWEIMSPDGGGEPTGAIAEAIQETFGSFEAFQEQFNNAGKSQFGSGWAWLVLNNGSLEVTGTANQDSPLMQGMSPIMGNDVWEHAYYLNYRNARGEYLKQWWNVVNWDEVERRYQAALA